MKKFSLLLTLSVVMVTVGILILSLDFIFPGMLRKEDTLIHLVSSITILSYLLLGLLSKRVSLPRVFRDLIIWGGIFLLILIGYSYKRELLSLRDRLSGILFPSKGQIIGQKTVIFEASQDGHFFVEGIANGIRLRFLVDTGATRVVLTRDDARLLGFDANDLIFNMPSSTAGGTVFSAPITLKSLSVGSIHLQDVPASVGGGKLKQSLLGMSFLERLDSYRVESGKLILKSP